MLPTPRSLVTITPAFLLFQMKAFHGNARQFSESISKPQTRINTRKIPTPHTSFDRSYWKHDWFYSMYHSLLIGVVLFRLFILVHVLKQASKTMWTTYCQRAPIFKDQSRRGWTPILIFLPVTFDICAYAHKARFIQSFWDPSRLFISFSMQSQYHEIVW